jgi:O-antigen ligase
MEYGVYVFVCLMFSGKLSTLREFGIYLPVLLWLALCLIKKELDLQWKEPLFICLLIFFLSAVVSSLFSVNPFASLTFKKEYLKIVLLYVAVSTTFARTEKLKKLTLLLAFAGIGYLILGCYQIVSDLLRSGLINYGETRYFSTVFLFFLPFIILQDILSGESRKFFWKVPLIGSISGILILNVRGGWLALAVVLGIWIYFSRGKLKSSPVFRRFGIKAAAIALASTALVFLLFPSQYAMVKSHTIQKVQMSMRLGFWKSFLQMSAERFFLGHGLDDRVMTQEYKESYKSSTGTYPPEEDPSSPHNEFIKILYQQGVAGLIAFILLLAVFIVRMVKTFVAESSGDRFFIGIAVVSPVIGEYVIRCLSEDRSLIPLGVLLGMAGAFLKKPDKVERTP